MRVPDAVFDERYEDVPKNLASFPINLTSIRHPRTTGTLEKITALHFLKNIGIERALKPIYYTKLRLCSATSLPQATLSACEQLGVTANLSAPQTGHYLFRRLLLLLGSSSLNSTKIRSLRLPPRTLLYLPEVMCHKLNPSSSRQSFKY